MSSKLSCLFIVVIGLAQSRTGFCQKSSADLLPRKAAFGVGLSPINDSEAKSADLASGTSAKVNRIVPGQTAESLKLQVGDIICKVGSSKFEGPISMQTFLRNRAAGDAIEITIFRNGKVERLKGTLKERPKQSEAGLDTLYTQVTSKGKRIRVIITSPSGSKNNPTIFMIGGIGAYSLDGNYDSIPYGNVLGPLAKSGYTIVRIDKPGQGDSEGPPYSELLFSVEFDAYLEAYKLARTLQMVNKDRIVIFGHSMGGVFGPMLAAKQQAKGLAVYGTLAKTWIEYQLENTRRQSLLAGAKPTDVDNQMRPFAALNQLLFGEFMSLDAAKKAHPELKQTIAEFSPDGKTYSGVAIPFFQELAKTNLAEQWSKVNCKTLAIWGENDFISTESDHQFIADIVNSNHPGMAEFRKLNESDHGFFQTTSQKDSLEKWGKGASFNPSIIDTLKTWLKSVLEN